MKDSTSNTMALLAATYALSSPVKNKTTDKDVIEITLDGSTSPSVLMIFLNRCDTISILVLYQRLLQELVLNLMVTILHIMETFQKILHFIRKGKMIILAH